LEVLQEGPTLDKIETAFEDRPVGTYREQLVSGLARLRRARADFERIRELGENAVVPEKEVIRARAEHEAAQATYRALKEQTRFDAQQQALEAQHKLQAAEAAVAISRSHLLILGYSEDDIDSMDPLAEAGRVAYYPVRSPIAGTVITRSAPLSQHVDDETELMEIADLSTVWLRADVFEKDLGATRGLQGKSVTFQVASYPGQRFTAEIFSPGDLVDDETRAARLLAVADNSEGLLRPGMFVEIELTPRNDADVLQLPAAAIQRHAGATFVFVSDDTRAFERRDVKLGRSTSELVEIREGLTEGESVVVNGGFALKSEMLSELMVEE
jgi:cobalt-zinc-cadmium efflux system membrane fusion protein